MRLTYAVVFEQGGDNYSGYAPDVPGCISVGATLDEMRAMMREAIELHVEMLLRDGDPLPEPEMDLDEARAHHEQPFSEDEIASWLQNGGTLDELYNAPPPIIEWLEVDVAVPEGAR